MGHPPISIPDEHVSMLYSLFRPGYQLKLNFSCSKKKRAFGTHRERSFTQHWAQHHIRVDHQFIDVTGLIDWTCQEAWRKIHSTYGQHIQFAIESTPTSLGQPCCPHRYYTRTVFIGKIE
jgi:hypothetical protein